MLKEETESDQEMVLWKGKSICKHLDRLTMKTWERNQINKTRNEKGNILMDAAEAQKIPREHHEQWQAHNFDILDEMDMFLETDCLPEPN